MKNIAMPAPWMIVGIISVHRSADVLKFERNQQDDETVVPVIQITYHDVKKKTVSDGKKKEKVWEWEPEQK